MRGAEAVLVPEEFLGKEMLRKDRMRKSYRLPELDKRLRRERTRREARLLHKAKLAGVSAPIVYEVTDYTLLITRIRGRKLSEKPAELREAGRVLAKLHDAGIIHGDFTPYNIIVGREGLHAIDFGLGFFSRKIEDQAVDLITMLKSLRKKDEFLKGYRRCKNYPKVMEKAEEIRKRARYQ